MKVSVRGRLVSIRIANRNDAAHRVLDMPTASSRGGARSDCRVLGKRRPSERVLPAILRGSNRAQIRRKGQIVEFDLGTDIFRARQLVGGKQLPVAVQVAVERAMERAAVEWGSLEGVLIARARSIGHGHRLANAIVKVLALHARHCGESSGRPRE